MGEQLATWLAQSEYSDLQPTHSAAIQPLWEEPNGARITTLAKASRITKQSMGALIDHLESCGYVVRTADADDARAVTVKLTDRGRALGTALRSVSKRIESDWSSRVGPERIAALIETLELLRRSLQDKPL